MLKKMKTVAVMAVAALAAGCLFLVGCAGSGESEGAGAGATGGFEYVDAAYVESLPADAKLVDVRRVDEFAAGHIPGAINVVYDQGFTAEEQLALFTEAGVTPEDSIVLYCRSGNRVMPVAETLMQAGYENVVIYKGSWNDWSSDASRPVEY